MKIIKLCALLAITTGLLGSGLAMADHGHGGGGHWRGNIGLYRARIWALILVIMIPFLMAILHLIIMAVHLL